MFISVKNKHFSFFFKVWNKGSEIENVLSLITTTRGHTFSIHMFLCLTISGFAWLFKQREKKNIKKHKCACVNCQLGEPNLTPGQPRGRRRHHVSSRDLSWGSVTISPHSLLQTLILILNNMTYSISSASFPASEMLQICGDLQYQTQWTAAL